MENKIRVVLVDDHPLVREGLVNLINQSPGLEVCGEAGNEPQALEVISVTRPDVAVVHITLENGSGLELLKNLKSSHPQVKPLVLSMHDENIYAERALHAGARGYIMKREAAKKVIAGIHAVHAGQLYVSEKIAATMAEKFVGGRPSAANASPMELLSDRELQVFELLGRGQGTRQISESLNVGFKTVQAYQARIKEKLQLANATELMRAAIRWHESKAEK
ncbi:MAG: response regulator transcription factor [Verrucomicrobia bacterium]|nr:response regulator transcription factor [Verrucomicrobiota bacterium]